ncbi:hypothetical protein B9Z19DRAFT_1134548 [Tuber borchii]|uniref:Uncharacterized protein n=1 Tax=Tuber borchii TaxID=42251 RepID=A0A2T6ZE17_TUBBO|nr:hypothetical protein B9Z19DRAFT_1134548 [Tuber borchii]
MQLACAPSEIKSSEGTEYTFSTDKCTYSIDPLPNFDATRNMMYIGFANYNGDSDHNLNNSKTECKGPNLLLVIWAKSRNVLNKSDKLDLNVLYCKPSYYYQTHEVTEDKTIDIITFEENVAADATVWEVNAK